MVPVKNNLAPTACGLAYSIEPHPKISAPVIHWHPGPIEISADEALAIKPRGPRSGRQNCRRSMVGASPRHPRPTIFQRIDRRRKPTRLLFAHPPTGISHHRRPHRKKRTCSKVGGGRCRRTPQMAPDHTGKTCRRRRNLSPSETQLGSIMALYSMTLPKAGCKKFALCTKYGSGSVGANPQNCLGVDERISVDWIVV